MSCRQQQVHGRGCALLAVLLLLGAVPANSVDWSDSEQWARLKQAQELQVKGQKQLSRGNVGAAERAYRRAIQKLSEYPESYLRLGALKVSQERFPQALEMLSEAEQRYVNWRDDRRMLEMIRRKDARADRRARVYYSRRLVAKHTPANQAFDPELALALEAWERRTERMGEAKDLPRAAEELAAIPAEVFYLEGIAELRMGRREAGRDDLRIALILDPEHGLAHYNLAVALFHAGDLRGARQHLEAALQQGVHPAAEFQSALEQATLEKKPQD